MGKLKENWEAEGKPRSTVDRQEMSMLLRCGRLL